MRGCKSGREGEWEGICGGEARGVVVGCSPPSMEHGTLERTSRGPSRRTHPGQEQHHAPCGATDHARERTSRGPSRRTHQAQEQHHAPCGATGHARERTSRGPSRRTYQVQEQHHTHCCATSSRARPAAAWYRSCSSRRRRRARRAEAPHPRCRLSPWHQYRAHRELLFENALISLSQFCHFLIGLPKITGSKSQTRRHQRLGSILFFIYYYCMVQSKNSHAV